MSSPNYQLWGGCFERGPAAVLQRLNRSLPVDQRLFREDIRGSQAYSKSLLEAGVISSEEQLAIHEGLEEVKLELEQEISTHGRLLDEEEDIHTVVEKRLLARIGEAALRLHTGRSRNDQVATDTRLWLMNALPGVENAVQQLIKVILKRAEDEIDVLMPGYTHMQRALPVRWSHYLLSHAWYLRDDCARLSEQQPRLATCPLGSGALAGCALRIDRHGLANRLGFHHITPNSMYAVSNRDFVVEFLNWCSLCSVHLSRLSEDLIMFNAQEFSFIRLSDEFSTGSSLMPHKRNPDGLELVRATSGALMGEAFGFLATLKGLPSTYNKDLQSDKEVLFRSYDRIMDCLQILTGTLSSLEISRGRMESALETSMLATDAAHELVRRGVPFRTAHRLAGAALRRAGDLATDLKHLPAHEFNAICGEFPTEMDWSWQGSVEQYTTDGGTAGESVAKQIQKLQQWLNRDSQQPALN